MVTQIHGWGGSGEGGGPWVSGHPQNDQLGLEKSIIGTLLFLSLSRFFLLYTTLKDTIFILQTEDTLQQWADDPLPLVQSPQTKTPGSAPALTQNYWRKQKPPESQNLHQLNKE